MAKIKGQTIPPELQKDFFHALNKSTFPHHDVLSRPRSHSGLTSPNRDFCRKVFSLSANCWNNLRNSSKVDWFQSSIDEGWQRYYNYFMHRSLNCFHAGYTPPWCRVCVPFKPLLEISKSYFDSYKQTTAFRVGPGSLLSLVACFSFKDMMYYEFVEDDDYTYFLYDYIDITVNGYSSITSYFPKLRLRIFISGSESCGVFNRYVDSQPILNHHEEGIIAHSRDSDWCSAVIFTISPDFMGNFEKFDLSVWIDQEHSYNGFSSQGIFWLHEISFFIDESLALNISFDRDPFNDPPPSSPCSQLINPTLDPWKRYSLDPPSCYL